MAKKSAFASLLAFGIVMAVFTDSCYMWSNAVGILLACIGQRGLDATRR